ncbi:MAG: epoxyqueuosine reductase QueH [Exilispira sp.]
MDKIFVLDVCCGICLLGVIPQLEEKSCIFVFSGDNICCEEEYNKRKEVFKKVCIYYGISSYFIIPYNHKKYLDYIKGFESEKEGKIRCSLCFEYRFINLFNNLKLFLNNFSDNSFDNNKFSDNSIYISTTLSVSRFKNYEQIKNSAMKVINNYKKNSSFFNSNFSSENFTDNIKRLTIGFYEKNFRNDILYKKSIQEAKNLKLYRQNFCGCEFSKPSWNKFVN